MIPWPPFDVITPLGLAECNGVNPDAKAIEWLCWIKASGGEGFFFRNPCIRRCFDLTEGQPDASDFTEVPNRKLRMQIHRYIKKGWLPEEWKKRFPEGSFP